MGHEPAQRRKGRTRADPPKTIALLEPIYAVGGEEEGGITRRQGDAMSTVPAEELAERQALGARYHAQRRIDQIGDLVRGIRAAINILIKEEKALLAEKAGLEGEGSGK